MPNDAVDIFFVRHKSFTEHLQVRDNGVPPREQRHRRLLRTSPRRRGPHDGTRSICQQNHISVLYFAVQVLRLAEVGIE